MPINQFNKPECEDCNEVDDYWRTAVELVCGKIRAEEIIAERMLESRLPRESKLEWAGRLSGLYLCRTKLEEILK